MKLYLPLLAALFLLSCKEEPATPKPVAIKVEDTTEKVETAKRDSIVAFAKQYLGTKYCYAGSDPQKGFDCSGFVYFVFGNFGIEVPRSSSGFKNLGTPLQPKDFRVGDVLVFYGYRDSDSVGHLGIISEANGMDSKFIHASSGSEMAVIISDLNSEMYTRRFIKAISVLE